MNQKLRRVMTIIIVFAVIWGGLTLLLPKKKKAPEETPPAPTPTWVEAQPGEGEAVETLAMERIKAKLPIRNNDFGIVYFKDSEQFGVTIFQGNFEEQKKKALDWFQEQGVVNPQNLAILWSATRWVTE